MTDPNIFNQIIVWPVINLLIVFYKPLSSLGVPGALGFSIILLTVAVRLLLYPLSKKQMQSAQEMQKLKPQIDKLAKKFKDKKRLQQEQLKLYQKHGINPAAGCLPTILQFPILIGLYRTFLQLLDNGDLASVTGSINKVVYSPILKISEFNDDFFGISLGVKPSEWQTVGVWLLLVPLITAVLSYYQTKIMAPGDTKSQDHKSTKSKKKKKESKKEDDFASVMQTQMKYIFPLLLGWISYQFPLGLTFYWNTFAVFGILQQRKTES
jgi:YidC/Oxa1 family membrane protein insertase